MFRVWASIIGTIVLYCFALYQCGHVEQSFPKHWVGNADPLTLQK